MNFLVDTHALLWLLTNDKKLSDKAKTSIQQANKIFIPTIVLLELMYLLEKKDQNQQFLKILKHLDTIQSYIIVALDMAVVAEVAKHSTTLEMHDRIILATAKLLEMPLISKDREISKLYPKTIW